jgi:hypothetical protein
MTLSYQLGNNNITKKIEVKNQNKNWRLCLVVDLTLQKKLLQKMKRKRCLLLSFTRKSANKKELKFLRKKGSKKLKEKKRCNNNNRPSVTVKLD